MVPALDDPKNQWAFCPSLPAAAFMAALFGLTTLFHTYQAIRFRKWYCVVIIMGGSLETLAMISRSLSIQYPTSEALYAIWFVLVLVSPLWINAFVYMIMGRMVYNFIPTQKIGRIPARRFGLYFVLLDVLSFIIQVAGAVQAVGNNLSATQLLRGIHIYMGGVGLQQFFIIIFMILAIQFHRDLRRQQSTSRIASAWRMLYVIYAVLILITARIIFRLVEYSSGFTSTIPNHEAYMYCLDSLPMLTALVMLNIVHPGAVMPGKESDLPSRKERKSREQMYTTPESMDLEATR
ncbi:putative lipid transporter atnI [Hyphodiscus hymeniophilus]|uniref:Lipid transporter atnI n=1 Tax=Hyphodiscus hymeniophilus TaxID=353542 RepID=A0A9P6VGM9_9HELO|nr:putative lipid transporter atnI [Hyphodiscus hymeniophilus]